MSSWLSVPLVWMSAPRTSSSWLCQKLRASTARARAGDEHDRRRPRLRISTRPASAGPRRRRFSRLESTCTSSTCAGCTGRPGRRARRKFPGRRRWRKALVRRAIMCLAPRTVHGGNSSERRTMRAQRSANPMPAAAAAFGSRLDSVIPGIVFTSSTVGFPCSSSNTSTRL